MGVRIFVVEDSQMVQKRIRSAIADLEGGTVVGVADNEVDAIRGILESAPDVVILDLQLKVGSGLRVLEAIRGQGCAAEVIVQTNFALPEYRARCQRYGADHFLDKTEDAPRLLELIADCAMRFAPGAHAGRPAAKS